MSQASNPNPGQEKMRLGDGYKHVCWAYCEGKEHAMIGYSSYAGADRYLWSLQQQGFPVLRVKPATEADIPAELPSGYTRHSHGREPALSWVQMRYAWVMWVSEDDVDFG